MSRGVNRTGRFCLESQPICMLDHRSLEGSNMIIPSLNTLNTFLSLQCSWFVWIFPVSWSFIEMQLYCTLNYINKLNTPGTRVGPDLYEQTAYRPTRWHVEVGHPQAFFLLFTSSVRSRKPGPTLVPGVLTSSWSLKFSGLLISDVRSNSFKASFLFTRTWVVSSLD